MHKLIHYFLTLSFITLLVSGCSKAGTKEFFFGSGDGPDPFVIGSTLSPLKRNLDFADMALPKPSAPLPPSKRPSRAQKASKILNLNPKTNQIQNIITQATGTVKVQKQSSDDVINFYEFDKQMQETYSEQSQNEYLLSNVLGDKKAIDPTISDYKNE